MRVLRLDPLKDEDIASILNARRDIDDARAFIDAARERGVDGLLANPQTLKMLADVVVRKDEWPKSRKETFEMACRQMIREHNEGHQAAQESGSPPAPDQLLDAAGRLCALQLISGGSGYTLRGETDEEYPAPDQCDYDSQVLRSALSTKLFKGVSSNRFTPVHRHVAEFLGGRHLTRVIEGGLPARRVISMMAGEDGTVVTELRGLSAWLAAHSRDARADLIERDPIGVGLYGDIGEFSNEEKRALLESLNREGSRLGQLWSSAAAFRALAAPELETVLREILDDSDRTPDHQTFTDFVLRLLDEGAALPGLSGILLDIVRDDTRWPPVNTSALNAFIHNCPDTQEKANGLKSLLADIRASSVPDSDNELLGILLYELYPRDLSPSEVWNFYFEARYRKPFFGMYHGFFMLGLLEKSSDGQVAELLDSLSGRFSDLRPALEIGSRLEDLPAKLLAWGLQAHGDQLATGHLYDWLDLGFRENLGSLATGDEADIQQIRSWMEGHPEIQKAVILEGLERCPESEDFWQHAFVVAERWYGANPPSDFGLWCLKQSAVMADEKPLAAEHLLELAFRANTDKTASAGLSLEVLREHTQRNETLKAQLNRLLAPPSTPRQQRLRERTRTFTEEGRQREEQWIELIRSNEVALRENRAAPALLHQIAIRYFGNSINVHSQGGPKDIEQELGDPNLIDAALLGIRGVIERKDVPGVEEILALRAVERIHCLGFPFLAALSEIEKSSPEELCRLDEDQMRKALAFHFSFSSSNEPDWYRRLLDSDADIVADVMIQSGKAELRGGGKITGLFALAHSENHAQVARHASLPLLRAFPTRCKLSQIESLKHLLWAALQHADRSALQKMIELKLSRKSMNDAQRVRWLAVGVATSPTRYKAILTDFTQGNDHRISHLAEFFCLQDRIPYSFDELGIPVLELLIRLVGSYVEPDQRRGEDADNDEGELVGPEMEAAWLVYRLIQRLAASPTKESSDVLGGLLHEPTLSGWHDELSRAQDTQRVIRRDACYRHPEIAQVCRTLNSGTPANAADLAALLMDLLQGPHERPRCLPGRAEAPAQGAVRGVPLALQIQSGNTDGWRQYWNVDSTGSPTGPRHEDVCRDALLSALRHQLPQGVDAQPEGHYANDNRADIRVSCGDFQVPVEVKRNMYRKSRHRDLWSALRNQLIAKYTTDPDTDGYGIYLVFWFGKKGTPPPPKGDPPANAKDLKERLEATLTPVEARKISVCVIDVSRPDK